MRKFCNSKRFGTTVNAFLHHKGTGGRACKCYMILDKSYMIHAFVFKASATSPRILSLS